MFHRIYNDLGDKWIMATDSEKNKINNKRDKKFLEFAREYQEKIGNIVETHGNTELKTISQIRTRLNLLLPENYLCSKECIVCIENPYGAWGETFDMEIVEEDDKEDDDYDEKYDDYKIAVKKILKRKQKKILQELRMVRKDQKSILRKLKNEDKPSVKASMENEYKKLERRENKIVEKPYDGRLFNEEPIFKKFTITEQKLYDILLEYIPLEKDESNPVNVRAIKNKGWGIVDEEKRCKIYKLFSKAVKENRRKWILSDSDLDKVYRKMFCPEYIKIIFMKEKLLKIGTPSGWMEIIEKNSKTEEEVINNLQKLERVLKKLGIEQQIERDSEPRKYTRKMYEEELEKMYKEREAETSEQ